MRVWRCAYGAHLALGARLDDVLAALGVGTHDDAAAAVVAHGEAPDAGFEVGARLLLLRVEAHALADELAAAVAPHVEWHLESALQSGAEACSAGRLCVAEPLCSCHLPRCDRWIESRWWCVRGRAVSLWGRTG